MTYTEARFILGLLPTFTDRDLKQAYRRAAGANHPDRGGSAERMVQVNAAYAVLSGRAPSEAREHFDDHRRSAVSVEAFRRYTGLRPRNPDLLDRYAVAVAAGFAVVAWIAGIIDTFNDFTTLRGWVVLGLPFSYVVLLLPVRIVFRAGVLVYNLAVKVRDRIGPLGA